MSNKLKPKPKSRFNMNELVKSHQEAQEKTPTAGLNSLDNGFDEKWNNDLKAYNENIHQLDEDYASLKPLSNVLIRVMVNPMEEDENGLLKPNTVPVKVETNNGVGISGFVQNPFPFSQKAIVVAKPESVTQFNVGDIVILTNAPVIGVKGRGDEAVLKIPNKFIHPDYAGKYFMEIPPQDPTDKNYGYLLVNPYDISFIYKTKN